MQEQWRPIEGYETLYEVSNFGSVRNKHGKLIKGFHQLKPSGLGYWRTTLSKNQKAKHFQTHRLVAIAFIPNPENKPQVNHIDYNSINNNAKNLEWCTVSENELHSRKNNRNSTKSSTAGKISAHKNQQKRLADATSNIGYLIGYWKILNVQGLKTRSDGVTVDVVIDITCTKCNSEKVYEYRYTKQFAAGASTMCKSCVTRKRYEERP